MEINPDRREVMHFEKSNSGRSIDIQWVLWMKVHNMLKVATQEGRILKKSFVMLASSGRHIEYKSWDIMFQLY